MLLQLMKVHGTKHSVIIVVFLSSTTYNTNKVIVYIEFQFYFVHIVEKDGRNMADTEQHVPRIAAGKSKTSHHMQMSLAYILLHHRNSYPLIYPY